MIKCYFDINHIHVLIGHSFNLLLIVSENNLLVDVFDMGEGEVEQYPQAIVIQFRHTPQVRIINVIPCN